MKTSSQDLGVVCKSTFWSVLKKKISEIILAVILVVKRHIQ